MNCVDLFGIMMLSFMRWLFHSSLNWKKRSGGFTAVLLLGRPGTVCLESIFSQKKKLSYLLKDMLTLFSHLSKEEDDYDVMQDPEFLQSVLENLPGVDPNNEAIRNAMGSLASQTGSKPDGKKDEEKKK